MRKKTQFPIYLAVGTDEIIMVESPTVAYQFKSNKIEKGAPTGFTYNILTSRKLITRLIATAEPSTATRFQKIAAELAKSAAKPARYAVADLLAKKQLAAQQEETVNEYSFI